MSRSKLLGPTWVFLKSAKGPISNTLKRFLRSQLLAYWQEWLSVTASPLVQSVKPPSHLVGKAGNRPRISFSVVIFRESKNVSSPFRSVLSYE